MTNESKELQMLREFFDVDLLLANMRNTPRAKRTFDWQVLVGKLNGKRSTLRRAIRALQESQDDQRAT